MYDIESHINGEHVLIVGNGLDRLSGMNSDFATFYEKYLKSYVLSFEEKLFYEIGYIINDFSNKNGIANYINKNLSGITITLDKDRAGYRNITDIQCTDIKTLRFSYIHENIIQFFGNYNVQMSIDKNICNEFCLQDKNEIDNLFISCIDNNVFETNYWCDYFENKRLEKNWCDLELYIRKAIIEKKPHSINLFNTCSSLTLMINDFNKINNMLNNFIIDELNNRKNLKIFSDTELKEKLKIDTLINFNYTSCLQYLGDRSDYLNIKEYNIHGKIDEHYVYEEHNELSDNDLHNKIVFGADTSIRNRNNNEEKINFSGDYLPYSKTFQLMKLDREFKMPKKVNKLSVIGHSMSENDYYLFYEIISQNIDNITLDFYYYNYYKKESNKLSDDNNKNEVYENSIKMLLDLESNMDKPFVNKFILENRINIKELNHCRTDI